MNIDDAGFSCETQAFPAMRAVLIQDSLVAMESIHQRIRRLRQAARLSQEALAKLVGIRYQSVQEWEREGGTAPARKRQRAVADVFGVSVSELMYGERPLSVSDISRAIDERIKRALPKSVVPSYTERRELDKGRLGGGLSDAKEDEKHGKLGT